MTKLTPKQLAVLKEMAAGAVGFRDDTITPTRRRPAGRLSTGVKVGIQTFNALLAPGFIKTTPTRLIGARYEITASGRRAATSLGAG